MQDHWKTKVFDVKACFEAGNKTSQGLRRRHRIWLPSFRSWSRKKPGVRKHLLARHPVPSTPILLAGGLPFHTPSPAPGFFIMGAPSSAQTPGTWSPPCSLLPQTGLWWRESPSTSLLPGVEGVQHLREGGGGDSGAWGNLPGLCSRQYMKSMQMTCKHSMQMSTSPSYSSCVPTLPSLRSEEGRSYSPDLTAWGWGKGGLYSSFSLSFPPLVFPHLHPTPPTA